jgi:hypothetical protein
LSDPDPDTDATSPHRAAVLLARAGWSALQDRILMDLCHDLNGRIATLYALWQLTEMGETPPTDLASELARLEGVAGRLSQLLGAVDEARPVPLEPQQLVERALRCLEGASHASHGSLDLVLEGALPAVLVNEGRCMRTILLFVDRAVALRGDVTFTIRGVPDGVELAFDVDGGVGPDDGADLALLDAVLRLDGGAVSVEPARCALTLPSLERARAEGR